MNAKLDDLEQWCRSNGGLAVLRKILEARGLNSAGTTYSTLIKRLQTWWSNEKISHRFRPRGYNFVETLDEPALRDELEYWDGDDWEVYDDNEDRYENIIRAQRVVIEQELDDEDDEETYERTPPSHPDGAGTWVESGIGSQRTHCSVKVQGEEAKEMSSMALGLIEKKVAMTPKLCKADMPQWKGLGEDPQTVLVESVIAGCVHDAPLEPASADPAQISLEGFALVPPFTPFKMDADTWKALVEVRSMGEAWQYMKVQGSNDFNFLLSDGEEVDLDDQSTWVGDVLNEKLQSLVRPSHSHDLSPKGLRALLGVRSGAETTGEEKDLAVKRLMNLAHESGINMAASRKGVNHPLPKVDPRECLKNASPVDGTKISAALPLDVRMELALAVGSSGPGVESRHPCEEHWWCMDCNLENILKASDFGSERLVREGVLSFTDSIKKAIVPLKGIWCMCGLLGTPPMGTMYQCVDDDCDVWIHTSSDYPCPGCEDCGLQHSRTRKTDANVSVSSIRKSVAAKHKDIDMAIYGYLRHNGGESIMEKGRHECNDISDMQIRMNELRAKPSECDRALPCAFTERVIGYGPVRAFDATGENGLCLEDGMLEFEGAQPAFSEDKMEKLAKGLKKGDYRICYQEPPGLSNSTRCTLYLAAYKRLLDLCVFCGGDNYIEEPGIAIEVCELEIKHALRRAMYPADQVKRLLTANLVNITRRLQAKARQPYSSQLFGFEAKRDKGVRCIGLVPHLGSEDVLLAVHEPKALALEELALEKMRGNDAGLTKVDKPESATSKDRRAAERRVKVEEELDRRVKERDLQWEKKFAELEARLKDDEKPPGKNAERNRQRRQKKAAARENAGGKEGGPVGKEQQAAAEAQRRAEQAAATAKKKAEEAAAAQRKAAEAAKVFRPPAPQDRELSKGRSEDVFDDSFWRSSSEDDEDSEAEFSSGCLHYPQGVRLLQEALGLMDSLVSGFVDTEKSTKLQLQPGEYHGEGLLPKLKSLYSTLPRGRAEPKKRVCPRFQTGLDCKEPYCCFAHELLPLETWRVEWQIYFLGAMGHKELEGEIDEAGVMSLLTSPQQMAARQLSAEARRALLLNTLQNRLTNLSYAAGEPMEVSPVQEGLTVAFRRELWGQDAPWKVGSPGGLPYSSISRVIFGLPDAIFNLTTMDVGQVILGVIDNMCQIKSRAATLRSVVHGSPLNPEEALDVRLLRQVLRDQPGDGGLLDPVLWELARAHPRSRLAEMLDQAGLAAKKGFSDALWGLIRVQLLEQVHCLTLGESSLAGGLPIYRLSLVGADVRGEVEYLAHNAHKLVSRRFPPEVYQRELSCTVSLQTAGATRHSEAGLLQKHETLESLLSYLSRIALTGKGRVIISGRGAVEGYAAFPAQSKGYVTSAALDRSRDNLYKLKRKAGEEVEVAAEEKATKLEVVALADLVAGPARVEADSNHDVAGKGPLNDSGGREEVYQAWRAEHLPRSLKKSKHFREALTQVVLPWVKMRESDMPQDKEGRADAQKHSMIIVGRFFNEWLLIGRKAAKSARPAFDLLVQAVRTAFFDGALHSGPSADEVRVAFETALTEGHCNLLQDIVGKGADPVHLDTRKGVGHRVGKAAEGEARLCLLKELFVEFAARRALIFDLTQEGIEEILMAAGVNISSFVTAPKTSADGEPRLGELGEELLRLCVNCRGARREEDVNTGIRSSEHTLQKTTSSAQVGLKVMQEEKKHPEAQVQMAKDDIVAAFKTVANLLRAVGLFACEVDSLAAIHLTMIFGSGASPGDFEPLGGGLIPKVVSLARTVFAEDIDNIGPLHPEMSRFVDDVLSVITMFGDRAHDHLARLRTVITQMFGPEGTNLEKQAEEGRPSNYKHAFGVVVDALDRLLMAPWSKIVKLYNQLAPFVNGDVPELQHKVVEKARGLAQHVLFCAPGIGRFVLPRLDAMLADTARRFPGGQAIPPDFCPSPKLKGESEAQGHKMLRVLLSLMLRLAVIEKGKLFRIPLETSQPREIRETWPGKEDSSAKVRFLMDASGTHLYAIDLSSGKWIQVEFTADEQALFNQFSEEADFVDINQREALSELFVIVVLGLDYPGKILEMINDNTSAESWTNFSRHSHARIEHILGVIGIGELTLRWTVTGSRVWTDENFADTGTRPELRQEHEEELARMAKQYDWPEGPREVKLPSKFRNVGWVKPSSQVDSSDWLEYAQDFIRHVEENRPGLIEVTCGVDHGRILEALKGARELERLPDKLEFDHDFDDFSPSEARTFLTSTPMPTRTQLKRERDFWQSKLGPTEGDREFVRRYDGEPGVDPERLISAVLEREHKKRIEVLKEINYSHVPGTERAIDYPVREFELPPGHRKPTQPLGLMSGFSGHGGDSQALQDSGWGRTLFTAESDPALREFNAERDPDASHFADVVELLRPECRNQAEIGAFSPPCQAHAVVNLHNQGNLDPFVGQYYENTGDIIENSGVSSASVECNVLVKRRRGEKLSPLQALRKKMPSYWVTDVVVKAHQTVSPLSGRKAYVSHLRLHCHVWHKRDYLKCPTVAAPAATPHTHAGVCLDSATEAQFYRKMPRQDQKLLDFEYQKLGDGAARVAKIKDPEPGRGNLHFVNDVVDPRLGLMPVYTASGGSKWIQRLVNNEPAITSLRICENARAYLLRRYDPSWLEEDSLLGQSVVGSMVPMNVSDWSMCLQLSEGSRVQADGLTAFEKCHRRWA